MTSLEPIVFERDGQATASSRDVAEYFGKQHANVLKAIDRVMEDAPEDFNRVNFNAVEYLDTKGQARRQINMTRDGFVLVVMGFTGEKAIALKIRFIEAFKRMEKLLAGPGRAYPEIEDEVRVSEAASLRMVAEARQLFGNEAAGQLWFLRGLPRVPAMVERAGQLNFLPDITVSFAGRDKAA